MNKNTPDKHQVIIKREIHFNCCMHLEHSQIMLDLEMKERKGNEGKGKDSTCDQVW